MKRTTLSDIAKALGVSKSLVSFVLSGKGKEHRISDEVCKKVFEVAKELNYQPNQIAKSLRTGRTKTIGLIIADMANPFFGKLGREIETEAANDGYRVMFYSSDENPEKSKFQINDLLHYHVDGLIISPPIGSDDQIKTLVTGKTPFVLIDRHFPEIETNYVIVDNFDAAYNATRHLINLGYTKIANITNIIELDNMKNRTEGYKQALIDAGLKVNDQFIKMLPFSHESKDVYNAIKQLCGNKKCIDAIFFSTSKIGVMGIESVYNMELKIPQDIAVVCFDDPDSFRLCHPPITAIAQPLTEMGKTAVQIIMNELECGITNSEKQRITLKTKLIVRKSCGS